MSASPFGPSSGGQRPPMTVFRKVTFAALMALVLDILVGAGFSNMSASDAPTALELDVIRWIGLLCLAVAATAWLMGRRIRSGAGS